MATPLRHLAAALTLAYTGLGLTLTPAQTVTWSSITNSSIVDSTGSPLDPTPGSYLFTLGTFDAGFDPLISNTAAWGARWHELDTADYTYTPSNLGYFTSSINIQSISQASYVSLFEGKTAYIWVYNPTKTEQFLSTAGSFWTLPNYGVCCSPSVVLTWSLSNLGSIAPVVGSQNNSTGGGEISNPGNYDLQTALIPESSTASLLLLTFTLAATIRRSPRITTL